MTFDGNSDVSELCSQVNCKLTEKLWLSYEYESFKGFSRGPMIHWIKPRFSDWPCCSDLDVLKLISALMVVEID